MIDRGTDVTEESSRRTCLVLAPHPDDETIGCGATIARRCLAGIDVHVTIVTDGRYSHASNVIGPDELATIRATEAAEACAVLGVSPERVTQLRFEEGTTGQRMQEVVGHVRAEIRRLRPDDVLVTSRHDWHADHRALNAAARRAAAEEGGTTRVLEYPVWFWADGPWLLRQPANLGQAAWNFVRDPLWARSLAAEIVRTDGFLEVKREALRAYRSQTSNLTGEPGWAVMDEDFLEQFLASHEVLLPADGSRP